MLVIIEVLVSSYILSEYYKRHFAHISDVPLDQKICIFMKEPNALSGSLAK